MELLLTLDFGFATFGVIRETMLLREAENSVHDQRPVVQAGAAEAAAATNEAVPARRAIRSFLLFFIA